MSSLRRQKYGIIPSLVCLVILFHNISGQVVGLNEANINGILQKNEIVFMNFYADWCRFSQILAPVFEEAANTIKKEYPQDGKIVFGKVDCDEQADIAARYHISKYPTLKIFRNGEVVKREYRGERSAEAIVDFLRNQVKDSVEEVTNLEQFDEIQDKGRRMVGYFNSKDSDAYRSFAKLSGQLREDCKFFAAFGAVSLTERSGGDNIIFRPPQTRRQDQVYNGNILNYDMLLQWASDKCMPLVREITFENAEELTEEGLPFLILFHKSEDTAIVEKFQKEVSRQLLSEKSSMNFLTADGRKFSHPLHHMGKSESDLPILAIDSFRHMYLFPHPVEDLNKPGLLKQFISDLHSGKLHREFHHGPDVSSSSSSSPPPPQKDAKFQGEDEPSQDAGNGETPPVKKTPPPVSTFQKLKPSSDRYTLLRDEL